VNVRLIAGKYGGRIIEGSGTERTHPMGERVRNAIFNKLTDELEDAEVLDAFAGSGALGFEALSRGAEKITFVERDRIAQKIIEKNIETLKVSQETKLIKAPVASWLETTEQRYDIIFADPPYHDPQLSTVFKLIRLLKPNGLMVLSYLSRSEVPSGLGVVVVDNRSYGNAGIAFYRREGA
jgi:16S rRNA (guanine966-N2)-methyltransferase